MSVSLQNVEDFYNLFSGNQNGYGIFKEGEVEKRKADEKLTGVAGIVYQTPSKPVFQRHLSGSEAIGISPLIEDGKVAWGCIDVDEAPKHEFSIVVRAIYDFNMPIVPFYSKSKHLHLFLFFSEPADYTEAIELLRSYAVMFDLPKQVEVFPKQEKISKFPSWLNLPYFGKTRCMLDKSMSELTLGGAIDYCTARRLPLKVHQDLYREIPYSDAPPCVMRGAILRDVKEGTRNNWIFSAGVYFLIKDERCDIEGALLKLNDSLDTPIDSTRLKQTVIHSMLTKTYFYKCTDLSEFCNKQYCIKTEYGIESSSTTKLEYGQIEQWMEDPPYYTWNINGQILTFYSESDIIRQERFREQCYKILRLMPNKIPDKRWAAVVNKASLNRIVHQADMTIGGFSTGSQFMANLISFFRDRQGCDVPEGLRIGRTYYDIKNKRFMFSASTLLNYLKHIKDFNVYSPMEVQTKLVSIGATKEGAYWCMPEDAVPAFEPLSIDMDIDFHDKEEENAKF
jgi:hypothetical protein